MKNTYIDLMETVMDAYSKQQLEEYTKEVLKAGIKEHGYPRLVANLGILIAHGKKTELKDTFLDMMSVCCREIPSAYEKNGFAAGNDFSVKEIVLCLLEIEKSGLFSKEVTNAWRCNLAEIEPNKVYSEIAPVPPVRINNWAAFSAASEQLRKYAGIADESDFIENQIMSQMFSFDENGMYRDPNEPIVYDLVTRLQLAVALHFGYDGKTKKELEKQFEKSEEMTLMMQSVTGEIPYGGRSNQFLHNEAFYAALCEFYATELKGKGELKKAGQFRRAARKATEHIAKWLNNTKKTHVKNSYDRKSGYGCEDYAYYKKYMITTASWLYIAYIMADDSIKEEVCPAENGGYVCCTSEYFHKVFCNCGDYFIEIDTDADAHYDASGLGRVHKKGVPSVLCLSTPCTATPNYAVDIEKTSSLAICGGIKTGEGFVYSCDGNVKYQLTKKKASAELTEVEFECTATDGSTYTEKYSVSASGVEICVQGKGELEVMFGVFDFDGEEKTSVVYSDKKVCVTYKGHKCRYTTNGIISDKKCICANRNGHYRKMAVTGSDRVLLKIELD